MVERGKLIIFEQPIHVDDFVELVKRNEIKIARQSIIKFLDDNVRFWNLIDIASAHLDIYSASRSTLMTLSMAHVDDTSSAYTCMEREQPAGAGARSQSRSPSVLIMEMSSSESSN